jgi:hypothetical protein
LTHVKIEPYNLFVVSSNDHIITTGMHIYTRDPLATRLVLCYDSLFHEIVLKYLHMSTNEEIGSSWVETDSLNNTLRLTKGSSCVMLCQTVNQNLRSLLDVVSHSRKIVTL